MNSLTPKNAILRVARPTENFEAIKKFYVDGLGFTVLATFEDHDGFDGMIIGHKHAPFHFEFVKDRQHQWSIKSPSPEHLFVLYVPSEADWLAAVARMKDKGFLEVSAHNPYWNQKGKTFEDPDGYRLILQNAEWKL